jgi:hypothetical protein
MSDRLPHRSELPGRQARGVGRSRERPWPHTNRTSSPKTSTWCFAASIPRRPLPRQDIISPTAAIASGPRCISPASPTGAFRPTRNGASSPMAAASRPLSTGPLGGPTRSRRQNSWQLGSDSRPRCVAGNQLSAAVRAAPAQRRLRAIPAEGAFEAADHGIGGLGRHVLVAAFAIRSELQHLGLS